MSKKEEMLLLLDGLYRSESGYKITAGFLKTNGDIVSMDFDKDAQYVFISQVKGIYDEIDGELVNKLTGTKIIGVKDFDGISYTDKRFEQNHKEVKEEEQKHEQKIDKPVRRRTQRPVVSELLNEKGEMTYESIKDISKK